MLTASPVLLAFVMQAVFAQTAAPPRDPVAQLIRKIGKGEVTLDYAPGSGYLPSLLKHLDINADSQILVFAKNSLQQELISPKNPRAIYFNDTVSIGAVPGGKLFEITALDPVEGLKFYTMPTEKAASLKFDDKDERCAQCHGPVNAVVPGIMVTTVFPKVDGTPIYTGGLFNITDQRTPFDRRWGGWYVSGTHGSQKHLGNAVAPNPSQPLDLETVGTQNLTSLEKKFDVKKYLVPTSDIVALMTFEHQTRMTNLMTSLSVQVRNIRRKGAPDAALQKKIDAALEELVVSALYADEEPLKEPVKGVSTFTRTFPQRGPRDKQGRSLRDFDLQKRIFKYPLSFMVYSEAFDNTEPSVKEAFYRRVYDVLSGKDNGPKFAKLSAADRRAVLEILRETKPSLPAYWKEVAQSKSK